MKSLIILIFSLSSQSVLSYDLRSFEAKYNISRNGKKTAEQITRLTQISDNLWRIEDQVTGTNGMASVIGFSRSETTEFTVTNGEYFAVKHHMQQKAAFSKKEYQFVWHQNNKQYEIKHKDNIIKYSPINQSIISTQLLPLTLSKAACQKQLNISMYVLKSKQPKNYSFILEEKTYQTAQRVYDDSAKRSSKVWFDFSKQCLPFKQIHQDHDEPEIQTTLTEFTWL